MASLCVGAGLGDLYHVYVHCYLRHLLKGEDRKNEHSASAASVKCTPSEDADAMVKSSVEVNMIDNLDVEVEEDPEIAVSTSTTSSVAELSVSKSDQTSSTADSSGCHPSNQSKLSLAQRFASSVAAHPKRHLYTTLLVCSLLTIAAFVGAAVGVAVGTAVTGAAVEPSTSIHPSIPSVTPSTKPFAQFNYGERLITDYNLGIEISEGLVVRQIAKFGEQVEYVDGNKSNRVFHAWLDGAGVAPLPGGEWVYISNSEDDDGKGGVYGVYFNKYGDVINYKTLLSGTTWNCGGGMTPWNTWVSCEGK